MTESRGGARSRLVLGAILLGTAALRLRFLAVPLERDEGEYAYLGQLILRGEIPYVAAHNMKLPGIYYAYAAVLAVFGETDVAIRAGLLVVGVATALLVHRIGRVLVDETAGLVAAATWSVLAVGPAVLGQAANAEHFVALPTLAGVLLLARHERAAPAGAAPGRVAGAGLLLGLAYVTKQHAAAFVLFGAAAVLLAGVRRGAGGRAATARELGAYAGAALAPFGAVCLAMALAGAFEPFWFWTMTYAREYVSFIPLAAGLAALRAESARIAASAWPLWLLVALGATAPAWHRPARRPAPFLALFAACSFLAVCPGLRFTEHYFLLVMPAAALLAGLGVPALAARAASRHAALAPVLRAGLPAAALAGALAQLWPVLALPPAAVARRLYGANPFPEAVEIGRWLRAHSDPHDRVGVVGSEPQIYFYARRRAATSYLYTYPMMEPQPFALRMQEEMIAQLERERPRFLVLVNVPTSWSLRPDSSRLLMDWAQRTVDAAYEPVGLAEIDPGGTTVHRWGAEARGATPRTPYFVATFERRRDDAAPPP